MSDVPPDFGAIYSLNQGAMYRNAVSVLRSAGRESEAMEVVQEAALSVMASPPEEVKNWTALLISTTRRRALDVVKAARVRRTDAAVDVEETASAQTTDIADEVAGAIDLEADKATLYAALDTLEERERHIVWETCAMKRSNVEVAEEFDLTPGRISQIKLGALKKLTMKMTKGKEDH